VGKDLTGPRRIGAQDLVDRIRAIFFKGDAVELLPYTISTADRSSIIRSSVKVADAIHLACAAESGVELFITHHKLLQKLAIPGIHFIAVLDTNLF
jgi:predicted nucleic acid-binding protein